MSLLGLFGQGGLLNSQQPQGLLGNAFQPNMPLLMAGLGMMGQGYRGALPGLMAGLQYQQQGRDREATRQAWEGLLGGGLSGAQGASQASSGVPTVPVPPLGAEGPSSPSPTGGAAAAGGRAPAGAARSIFAGLVQRGFSPVQAAAITGNIQQESGFNPQALNQGEGAHGLIQWRGPRWQALQQFAAARGGSPTDVETQLDFIRHEMQGSERTAGQAFMGARTLDEANNALRRYIRYGDDSQGTRLANAQRWIGQDVPAAAPGGVPAPTAEGFLANLAPRQRQALATLASRNPAVAGAVVQRMLAGQQQQRLSFQRQGNDIVGLDPTTGRVISRVEGEAEQPRLPAQAQLYEYDMQQREAQGQPRVPFAEWSKERKGPLVQNVLPPAEKEYAKTRGRGFAETAQQIEKEAREADTKIGQYQQLDALLSDPNVYTGTGGALVNALKKAGKTLLGMEFVKGVGSAEAAQRITRELALQMGQLMRPMSDSDRKFVEQIPPNISDSAEGRKLVVQMVTDAERRKVEIARLARAYERVNGQLDRGWGDELQAWLDENPMFSPERQQEIMNIARGAQQPSPAAGVAPQVRTAEEYENLPSGSVYLDPSGNLRRKP